jgi:small GTP-binding protein
MVVLMDTSLACENNLNWFKEKENELICRLLISNNSAELFQDMSSETKRLFGMQIDVSLHQDPAFLQKLLEEKYKLKKTKPLEVAVIGATGVGKSSTINAILGKEVAKIGESPEPETNEINKHPYGELINFCDTPGLGDSETADDEYIRIIREQLELSNVILLIKDGANKDLSMPMKLMHIVPEYKKVILCINRSDISDSGKNWNVKDGTPTPDLEQRLLADIEYSRKALSKPFDCSKISSAIYYSAFCNYNIDALVAMIIENIPFYKATG